MLLDSIDFIDSIDLIDLNIAPGALWSTTGQPGAPEIDLKSIESNI